MEGIVGGVVVQQKTRKTKNMGEQVTRLVEPEAQMMCCSCSSVMRPMATPTARLRTGLRVLLLLKAGKVVSVRIRVPGDR